MIHPMDMDFAGWTQKLRDAVAFGAAIVTVASTVANALPKYEKIADPVLRKAYQRGVVAPIAFLALNWRTRLPSMNWKIFAFSGHAQPACPHCGRKDGEHDNVA